MEDKAKILIFLKRLGDLLKTVNIKSDVTFPEVQRVIVDNQPEFVVPDTFKIEDLERVISSIDAILPGVSKEMEDNTKSIIKSLKPEKNEKLSGKLLDIKKAISSKDNKDIVRALYSLEKIIKDKDVSVDLSNISKSFKTLLKKLEDLPLDPLTGYSEFGEVRTKLNPKQFETLVKAMKSGLVAISSGSSGGGSSPSALTSVVNKGSTAVLTNVSSSATSQNLIALNTSRIGLVIVNDSTQILYVKYGSTASSSSFSYKLYPQQTLELNSTDIYTGFIDGVWASANGAARITEITL